MKKIFPKIVTAFFICSLILTTHVFAARSTFNLPKNQEWVYKYETRTGSYSTVLSRLYAVYPTDGSKDNFKKIQVRISASGGEVIGSGEYMSDLYILDERVNSNSIIPLYDGLLYNMRIYFQFRGNSSSPARADVYYNGR